jgi:hypothetical protein
MNKLLSALKVTTENYVRKEVNYKIKAELTK